MDVEEIKNEGLLRQFKVTLSQEEMAERIDMILREFRNSVPMKGFRPGKAPLSLLKQLHGQRARAKAIEDAVGDHTEELFRERELRPAMQPKIDVGDQGDQEIDAPVTYNVDVEVLPVIDIAAFEAPALTRPKVAVEDAEVQTFLEQLAEQQISYEETEEERAAEQGDSVLIDFVGSIEGEEFDGGKGEDFDLVLGSGQFIPGFEDQLVGAKAGDTPTVKVTFPEAYQAEHLAGKEAAFAVTVKAVKIAKKPAIDDELAISLGMDNLDALKDTVRQQIEAESAKVSRAIVKRRLLDALAELFDFDVPPGMVDMEYRQIWGQVRDDMLRSGEKSQEELEALPEPEEEKEREEFKQIAERRVRLGLLLSELGTANEIQITREEMNAKMVEEARRYPGQEQQVLEFYQKNEQARAQLRAPVYEDKVVDFILEKADITEETVTQDELKAQYEALDEDEPVSA